MTYQEFKPRHPLLVPYIEYYNSMQCPTNESAQFISVPEGKMGLTFMLGGYSKIHDFKKERSNHKSLFFGMIQQPTHVLMSKDIFTFSIVFKSNGLSHFTDIPLYEILQTPNAFHEILGPEIIEVEDSLGNCTSFSERISIIETYLLKKFKIGKPRIDLAVNLIFESNGLLKLKDLCLYLNTSTRQLRQDFIKHVGVSPKQLIRMSRFRFTISKNPGKENLTQYAYRCGYYDQAHFIHDFKTFSGMTPGKYFNNKDLTSDFYNYKRLMIN